jgi:hypothetical protein
MLLEFYLQTAAAWHSFECAPLIKDDFLPGKFDPIGQLAKNFGVCDLGARSNVSIASPSVVID